MIMAAVFTLVGGCVGLIVALAALTMGAGPAVALMIWSATGVSALLMGLALTSTPRQETAPFIA
jgi:uncharacterized membrane protein